MLNPSAHTAEPEVPEAADHLHVLHVPANTCSIFSSCPDREIRKQARVSCLRSDGPEECSDAKLSVGTRTGELRSRTRLLSQKIGRLVVSMHLRSPSAKLRHCIRRGNPSLEFQKMPMRWLLLASNMASTQGSAEHPTHGDRVATQGSFSGARCYETRLTVVPQI